MRRIRMVVVLAVVATVGLLPVTPAWAVCAPRFITVEPSSGAPGESFVVRGRDFGTTCDDTSSPDDPSIGLGPPDEHIPIRFVQGERMWELTIASADEGYAFEVTVEVPSAADAGEAVVQAEGEGETPEAAFEVVESRLPRTGGSVLWALLSGAGLIAGGAVLLMSRRSASFM